METEMTTQTVAVKSTSRISAAILAVAFGIGIVAIGGNVQAAGLHDAAHDVRHATGFPCH